MSSRVIVVGSGPAGVACARALAERGHEVTIVDAGRVPDDSVAHRYAALENEPPTEWDPELVEELRAEFKVGRDELPLKPVLGSLHPYATADPSAPLAGSEVGLVPSLARGGLSTVWGASMLPYREADLAGWPLGLDSLDPFYRSVLRFVPLAARSDDLAPEFPLYSEEFADLEPTAQIAAFLADLQRAGSRLRGAGVNAGRARLAVRTMDNAEGRGCRYTGLCLHGCPLGSIWSAGQALASLRSRWPVAYLPDAYVERIEETSTGVRLIARMNGSTEQLDADRVFVAAGVLPTARLLLHSLDASGESVELRDSQVLHVPLAARAWIGR